MHFCSPIGRAFTIESVSEMATPILAQKGIELHTFFNVETIEPDRKVVQSLEGEELPYDLLVLVPPFLAVAIAGCHHCALPAVSAPLACHRCCQVSPGWPANQSSSRNRLSRRR